jgi:3-oxoacyl-(acyl-carrier-protein) synthase
MGVQRYGIEAPQPIAVVGLGIRFPGASSLVEFWHNLSKNRISIRDLNETELAAVPVSRREHPRWVRQIASCRDIKAFDADLFGISPQEAPLISPEQRILLETSWEALESAGLGEPDPSLRGGVVVGVEMSSYLLTHLMPNLAAESRPTLQQQALNGNTAGHTALRLAQYFDLRGPAYAIDSACSSSLLAIHQACGHLLNQDCDFMLAGGASFAMLRQQGYIYSLDGLMSPTGEVKVFDRNASGTVFGSGGGIAVLMRHEDAIRGGHPIHALIRGSAVLNAGTSAQNYQAPSLSAQAEVMSEALSFSQIDASDVGFIECHAVGTHVGDATECAAYREVFQQEAVEKGRCALGSVKTNIGHLSAAAGLAGFVKTVLMLEKAEILPQGGDSQNSIDWHTDTNPFYIPRELAPWAKEHGLPRAGVSSFGIGGTYVHVLMEQATPPDEPQRFTTQHGPCLFAICANSPDALGVKCRQLAARLTQSPETHLRDLSLSLFHGQHKLHYRRIIQSTGIEDLIGQLYDKEQPHEHTKQSQRWQRWVQEYQDYKIKQEDRFLRLPPYPFERTLHWVEKSVEGSGSMWPVCVGSGESFSKVDVRSAVLDFVGEVLNISPEQIDLEQSLNRLGMESVFLPELAERLERATGSLHGSIHLTPQSTLTDLLAGAWAAEPIKEPAEPIELPAEPFLLVMLKSTEQWRLFWELAITMEEEDLGVMEPLNALRNLGPKTADQARQMANFQAMLILSADSQTLCGIGLWGPKNKLWVLRNGGLAIERDKWIFHIYVVPEHRHRISTTSLQAWLHSQDEYYRKLKEGRIYATLRSHPELTYQYIRAMAQTLSYTPLEENQLFCQCYHPVNDPSPFFEELEQTPHRVQRFFAALDGIQYKGVTLSSLLSLPERPLDEVIEVLAKLGPPEAQTSFLDMTMRLRAGQVTFLGFELRWLEPIFVCAPPR